MPTKCKRYLGAMVGTLCGDAVAAEYENKTAEFIRAALAPSGGRLTMHDYIDPWKGKRLMKAGQPTDDSELAAALGLSLVNDSETFGAELIYIRLRDFIHGGFSSGRRSVLTSNEAYGSGGTLRAALRPNTYKESLAAFGRGEIPIIPSNGSLMRAIAVPLRYQGNIERLVKYARWQSCITHMHPVAQAACIAHAVLVSYVLDGENVSLAWETTKSMLSQEPYSKIPELAEVLQIDTSEPDDSVIWPHTGSVLVSLRVALWASTTAEDFEDGIAKATLVGGDTDTYAAIAGGILGARYGVSGIPTQWLEAAQGRDTMTCIAEKLYLSH